MTCFFLLLSTKFIWQISFSGNTCITDDVLNSFLANEGIRVGCLVKNVDIESIEKKARTEFPQITWISARISGTVLNISVKESDTVVYPEKKVGCADLIAEKDGQIISMVVRNGVPMVKTGDRVEPGMLLVSGEIPVYNDDETVRTYRKTYADADIKIIRTQTVYETLPFTHIQKVYTGREKEKFILILFGREFTFGKEGGFLTYDTVEEMHSLTLVKGFSLPVSFGKRIFREYQNTEMRYSLKEAEEILSLKYLGILRELAEKNHDVVDKKVKIDSTDQWILTGELTVEEKIGIQIER